MAFYNKNEMTCSAVIIGKLIQKQLIYSVIILMQTLQTLRLDISAEEMHWFSLRRKIKQLNLSKNSLKLYY